MAALIAMKRPVASIHDFPAHVTKRAVTVRARFLASPRNGFCPLPGYPGLPRASGDGKQAARERRPEACDIDIVLAPARKDEGRARPHVARSRYGRRRVAAPRPSITCRREVPIGGGLHNDRGCHASRGRAHGRSAPANRRHDHPAPAASEMRQHLQSRRIRCRPISICSHEAGSFRVGVFRSRCVTSRTLSARGHSGGQDDQPKRMGFAPCQSVSRPSSASLSRSAVIVRK